MVADQPRAVTAALSADAALEASRIRFDRPDVSTRYPSRYGRSLRDRLEQRCIRQLLAMIPPGSHVLDLPCGTGRLIPLMRKAGLRITGADSSPRMIERAEENSRQFDRGGVHPSAPRPHQGDIRFQVADALETGFADGEFDAVFCNRLFHHFFAAETRIAALRELRRIARGPVIVSYFDSFALDALRRRVKNRLRGIVPTDRVPIPWSTFAAEIRWAGLEVVARKSVMWGISPMCYVVVQSHAEKLPPAPDAMHGGTRP